MIKKIKDRVYINLAKFYKIFKYINKLNFIEFIYFFNNLLLIYKYYHYAF